MPKSNSNENELKADQTLDGLIREMLSNKEKDDLVFREAFKKIRSDYPPLVEKEEVDALEALASKFDTENVSANNHNELEKRVNLAIARLF